MKSSDNRISVIDWLRGISVLLVMGLHTLGLGQASATDFWHRVWFRVMANGAYGVSIFFVVSGFVITRTLILRMRRENHVSVENFYIRRISRLWPLLLLIVVWGSVASFYFAKTPALQRCFEIPKFDAAFWLSLLFFVLNWFFLFRPGEYGIHWGVLWSLAIEEQFYLVYPLLIKYFEKNKTKIFAVLGILIFIGPFARWAEHLCRPEIHPLLMNSFASFELLAWGCFLFFASEKSRDFFERNQKIKLLTLWAGLFILGNSYIAGHFFIFDFKRVLAPTGIAIGVWGMVLGGERNKFFENPAMKAISSMGRLSYGVYLFHSTAIFILWPLLPKVWESAAFLLVALLTGVMAWTSDRYFEKPVRRWILNRFNLSAI